MVCCNAYCSFWFKKNAYKYSIYWCSHFLNMIQILLGQMNKVRSSCFVFETES